MSKDHMIISKGMPKDAVLGNIRLTVQIFKGFIKKHYPQEPTCNQSMYVKDVEYLLQLLQEKL